MVNKIHFVKNGLMTRVMAIVFLGTILTSLIWLFTYYQRHWNLIEQRLAQNALGEVNFILNQAPNFINDNYSKLVFSNFSIKLSSPSLNECKKAPKSASSKNIYFTSDLIKSSPYNLNIIAENAQFIEIMAIKNNQCLTFEIPIKRLTSNTSRIFILISMLGSLLVLITTAIFLKNQIRPFVFLAKMVNYYGQNQHWENMELPPQIKPTGSAEARLIARAFNGFFSQIHNYFKQRTEMLSGVSHDLRTPLTRMKLQIAMMEETPETKRLMTNINEMDAMLGAYLQFIQMGDLEPWQEVNIMQIFHKIQELWQVHHPIYINTEQEIIMTLRPKSFARAMENIVSNAVNYGQSVWINARIDNANNIVQIMIDDDGHGIAESERDLVFKPFYRTDKARTRSKNGGVGLGLTVAHDIITQHHGTINLDASPFGGLRVIIKIPYNISAQKLANS